MKNIYICPECGSTESFYRTGVHFDHEKKCCKCGHCWDPYDIYDKYVQEEEERLKMNTSKE